MLPNSENKIAQILLVTLLLAGVIKECVVIYRLNKEMEQIKAALSAKGCSGKCAACQGKHQI